VTINAVDEPYQAGEWLVSRHITIKYLLNRVDCWEVESGPVMPDLEKLAKGINASDHYGAEWKAYEYLRPAPRPESFGNRDDEQALYDRAYQDWEDAGPPEPVNPVAVAFGPMSSGEKRMLRMLAVLAPTTRVLFRLSDSDGIDQPYKDDWRRLVAGFGVL
jgi:hypothetical protein